MPGAWEMLRRGPEGVLIGIPSTGGVTIDFALELLALAKPPNTQIKVWRGMPIDVARNRLVKDAREMGAKYIFFQDSDQIAERNDALIQLMSLQLPIISGLYWSKKSCPCMWRLAPGGQTYSPITQFPESGLLEVDVCGCGCCLIDMRVFDHIPPPWFVWEVDDPMIQAGKFSEDFHFFRKAKAAGYKVLVHTGIRWYHEQTISWNALGHVAPSKGL